MKRLTCRADFGLEEWEETLLFVESDPNGAYNIIDIAKQQGDTEFDEILKNVSLRLADIEDIISDENGEYDLDLIAEIVKAKREGRCVVFPCKIGGKLYSAFPLCGVNSHQIRKFEINKDGMFACSALMIPFSDVGKTVFLTREAAEQALKEYKDGRRD